MKWEEEKFDIKKPLLQRPLPIKFSASAGSVSQTVLPNPNILHLTFRQFFFDLPVEEPLFPADRSEYLADKNHLLSAALVCKAFSEPALDLLWRQMDTLLPLFKIFTNFTTSNGIHTFNGPFSADSVQRFRQYARRIKILTLNDSSLGGGDLAPHSYVHLCRTIALSTILPALHTLSISSENFNPTALLLLIRPMGLLNLILSHRLHDRSDGQFSLFLASLSRDSPTVRKIRLGGAVGSQTLDSLGSFLHLQHLDLTMASSSDTEHLTERLASIRALSCLSVTMEPGVHVPVKSGGKRRRFRALRSLDVVGDAVEVYALATLCQIPMLETLNVTWVSISPPARLSEYPKLAILALTDATATLHKLCLSTGDGVEEVVVMSPSLFSISSFPSVRHLELSGLAPGLSNLQIHHLCQSGTWGSLQALHIPDAARDKTLTLQSLGIFAWHCPNLSVLSICVHLGADNVHSLEEEMQELPPPNHQLKKLRLCKWSYDEKLEGMLSLGAIVARYVDYLFPFLQSLRSYDGSDREWWKGISDIIASYRENRSCQCLTNGR